MISSVPVSLCASFFGLSSSWVYLGTCIGQRNRCRDIVWPQTYIVVELCNLYVYIISFTKYIESETQAQEIVGQACNWKKSSSAYSYMSPESHSCLAG